MSTLIEKMRAELESEEGQRKLALFVEKLRIKEEVIKNWCRKFHDIGLERRREIILKIVNKYKSNEYKDRYWKKRVEPQEYLLSVLLEYAAMYGEEVDIDEDDMFATESYVFDDIIITLHCGQGSFISIERLNLEQIK